MTKLGRAFALGQPFGFGPVAAPPRARVVNVDSDTAYWIGPHPDGAVAHLMKRNEGKSDPTDTGSPWEPWRRVGTYVLPSYDSDPTGTRTIYSADSGFGALDYAYFSNVASAWAGSYHGGETVDTYSGPDFTSTGPTSASFSRTTTVTNDSGEEVAVTYTLTINRDGTLTERITTDSTDAFSQAMFGMEIGTGANWTQYSLTGAAPWTDIAGPSTINLADATDITMRDPVSGLTIRCVSNAPTALAAIYDKSYLIRQSARLKTYFQASGVPVGTATRTITFGTTEPDPAPLFAWDGATDGETWTEIPVSASVSLDGDDLLMEAGVDTGVAFHRALFTVAGLTENTTYRLPVSAVASDGSSARSEIYLTPEPNGSNANARNATTAMSAIIAAGYVDFTTVAGETALTLLVRQSPLASSSITLRVSSLGPLAETP